MNNRKIRTLTVPINPKIVCILCMIDVNVIFDANRDDCTVYHFWGLFDFAFNIKQLNISIFVSVLTVVFDIVFVVFMSCYRLEQHKRNYNHKDGTVNTLIRYIVSSYTNIIEQQSDRCSEIKIKWRCTSFWCWKVSQHFQVSFQHQQFWCWVVFGWYRHLSFIPNMMCDVAEG